MRENCIFQELRCLKLSQKSALSLLSSHNKLKQINPQIMKLKLISVARMVCGSIAILLLFFVNRVSADVDLGWETNFTGPETFWGAETNGIKVAMLVDPLVSSNNVPILCTPVIKSVIKGSNIRTNVYFLPPESGYQMTLKDDKGNLVSKTAKGKSLGQPITQPLMVKIGGLNMRAGFKMRPLIQNHSEVLSDFSFNLQDYFVVTNSGKYQLTYEMRVVLPHKVGGTYMELYTTNFTILTLPPVVAAIEIVNRLDGANK